MNTLNIIKKDAKASAAHDCHLTRYRGKRKVHQPLKLLAPNFHLSWSYLYQVSYN